MGMDWRCSRYRWGKVGETETLQKCGLSRVLHGQNVFDALFLRIDEKPVWPMSDRQRERVAQSVTNRGYVQGPSILLVDRFQPLALGFRPRRQRAILVDD